MRGTFPLLLSLATKMTRMCCLGNVFFLFEAWNMRKVAREERTIGSENLRGLGVY